MRLVNVETLKLYEFSAEGSTPPYAVLSHTWGNQELSYLDLLFLTSELPAGATSIVQALLRSPSRESAGFQKVAACCQLAQSRGLQWVWIDTCCIDKSSSAELSEAINSMWSWYRSAVECYVYLHDVSSDVDIGRRFRGARWFSRGWTLQELLAPQRVFFCSERWEVFAEKTLIVEELSAITNIPAIFLDSTYDPCDGKICSVAMKMSWLSRRETTRVEDMAYCMLGLFDVHMPLIYGEGRKAFMRLQLEILKKSDDDSIYAWKVPIRSSGLLATWPTAFASSANLVQIDFPRDNVPWLPPVMTSIGLELKCRYQRNDTYQRNIDSQLDVHSISMALPKDHRIDILMHCTPCDSNDVPVTQKWGLGTNGEALVIRLQRFGSTWQRINCQELEFADYVGDDPDELIAYTVYYIEQQGL